MLYEGNEEKHLHYQQPKLSVYYNSKLCENIVTFVAVKVVLINEYNKTKAFNVCKQLLLLTELLSTILRYGKLIPREPSSIA